MILAVLTLLLIQVSHSKISLYFINLDTGKLSWNVCERSYTECLRINLTLSSFVILDAIAVRETHFKVLSNRQSGSKRHLDLYFRVWSSILRLHATGYNRYEFWILAQWKIHKTTILQAKRWLLEDPKYNSVN